MRGADVSVTSNGRKVYSFPAYLPGPDHAALLGTRAYAVGSDKATVATLAARVADGKPPDAVADELRPALAESADPPLVAFAAGPNWPLPGGAPLGQLGVQRAAAMVRLDGEGLAVEIVLAGRRLERLTDFRRELGQRLSDRHPGLVPFANALARADQSVLETGSGVEVTYRCRIGLTEVREAFERLLSPLPGEKK
jgi:hypothetical protein